MRHHLPVVNEHLLDNIGVATPCSADWSHMKGDDRVRHCSDCRQNVYNLSAMSRLEAAELVARREGRVCVRLLKRADGTVVTRDCRELLARARRRGLWAFAAALAVVGLMQFGLRVMGLYLLVDRWSSSGREPLVMGAIPAQPVVPAVPAAPTTVSPEVEREVLGEMAVPPPPAAPKREHILMGKLPVRPR